MLKVLYCTNCNESVVHVGQISATISLNLFAGSCSTCGGHKEDSKEIYFCSASCLVEYVKEHCLTKETLAMHSTVNV